MHALFRRASRGATTFALLAMAASVLVLATTARPATACSCAARTDVAAFADADAVFTGVLVDVVPSPGEGDITADSVRFVFEVERVYKGEVLARQSVVARSGGASCGLEFPAPTGRILVFGRRGGDAIVKADDDELAANLCNGTRPVLASTPVPFGEGTLPVAGASPIPSDPPPPGYAGRLAIIGGVAVAALGAFAFVRRRRA